MQGLGPPTILANRVGFCWADESTLDPWVRPLIGAAFAVYTSLRPFEETNASGYLSLPQTLNLDNYLEAWGRSELVRYFLSSLVIVVPAVVVVLFLASMMAFAVSRYSWRLQSSVPAVVHGGQPASAAGSHHAAVPHLPAALVPDGRWGDRLPV